MLSPHLSPTQIIVEEAARRERLARLAKSQRSGRWIGFRVRFGVMLIQLGNHLQRTSFAVQTPTNLAAREEGNER